MNDITVMWRYKSMELLNRISQNYENKINLFNKR